MDFDVIEMTPLSDLFERIVKSRGGEMLLVHIAPGNIPEDPDVQCMAAISNTNSTLIKLIPTILGRLQKIHDDKAENSK